MPALTFTADSVTDQLTIVGHGLLTGDGPGQVRNFGGALPAPLITANPYWVIRVDDDHIKLATSQAAALLGTAINLTTNGTGTHSLEIGLPFARATTYAAGSQIKSRDLNALQDCVIGGRHGPLTRWFPPRMREENNQGTVTFTNGFVFAGANASAINYVSAPIDQGERIVGLRARVKGTGAAGNVVVTLARWRDGVQTVEGTLTIVNPPNSWASYSVAIGPVVVADGDCFWFGCSFALINQGITAFGLDYDRA